MLHTCVELACGTSGSAAEVDLNLFRCCNRSVKERGDMLCTASTANTVTSVDGGPPCEPLAMTVMFYG
jgi:hypothetical protein